MPRIEKVEVAAFTVPTDAPEADGTLEWDSTTIVVVHARAGGETGVGYSYGEAAAAVVVADKLAPAVCGCEAMDVNACWLEMRRLLRNAGLRGIGAHAVSAVDAALWDLKARLLGLPLAVLLGQVHAGVPVYGSGGFTSYTVERLREQLGGWVEQGIAAVKMKVGSHPEADLARVASARDAIGSEAALYVDANGAYARKQALRMAEAFAGQGVVWLEEPVSSDDLEGLRLIRDRAPAGIEVAAGEYGYDAGYFRRMLAAGAVDVLQADATRCCGITGFLQAAALADAFGIPLSAHTAPALHLHPCCAVPRLRPLEWFHDHARIEGMLFDGPRHPQDGLLSPDLSRPGLGITFREKDAAPYAV